jgi:type VI protein secretion system component VasK
MAKFLQINQLIDKLTELIKLKGEQLKLEAMSYLARFLAVTIVISVISLIAFFLIFFLALTLAVYLNGVLESQFLGYLIVSGIILIKLIISIFLLKSGKMQKWIETMIIKSGESDE